VMQLAILDSLAQDIRFTLRGLKQDRRFSFTVLAAIAIAVGCASAVFSVVDRSLFRALPYHQGDRLVTVGAHNTASVGRCMPRREKLFPSRQRLAIPATTPFEG